jgi:hypothetical protein
LPQRYKIIYRALFATSVQHDPATTCACNDRNAVIRIVDDGIDRSADRRI